MDRRMIIRRGGVAATLALAVGAVPALAAGGQTAKPTTRTTRAAHVTGHRYGRTAAPGNGETALTGATLSSASAAALAAVPGGTVLGATTETDSSNTSAAYEVHVRKSDGTVVTVIEDASFKVLSTATGRAGGCAGMSGPSTSGTSSGYAGQPAPGFAGQTGPAGGGNAPVA